MRLPRRPHNELRYFGYGTLIEDVLFSTRDLHHVARADYSTNRNMAKDVARCGFAVSTNDKFNSKGTNSDAPGRRTRHSPRRQEKSGATAVQEDAPQNIKKKTSIIKSLRSVMRTIPCPGGPVRLESFWPRRKKGDPLDVQKPSGSPKISRESKFFTCGTGAGGPRPTASLVIDTKVCCFMDH